MQIQDVMTQQVISCDSSTNAAAAAELMWIHNIGSLPVVKDGEQIVGIVTDRDLFIALGTSNCRPSDLTVGDVMQTDLARCFPEDNLRTALQMMGYRKLHRLPVVDGFGKLLGMVSIDDIIGRATGDGASKEEILRALREICSGSECQGRTAVATA